MGCAQSKAGSTEDDTGVQDQPQQAAFACVGSHADALPPVGHELVPGAQLPADEERRRLKALMDCRVLDTPDERCYDTITSILAAVFKVPVSVVGLIADDHLWLKSIQGVEERTCNRLHSFCDASLRLPCPSMMVVPDTLADSRFQHNQFVTTPPYVRFYAGAPLVSSEGHVLGSLAVMDIKPRTIPAEIACLITNFAELVVRELEKNKVEKLRQLKQEACAHLVRSLSAFDEAVMLCDVRGKGWPVMFVNSQWCKATGMPESACLRSGMWALFHFATAGDTAQMLYTYAAIEEQKPFALQVAAGPAPSPATPAPAFGAAYCEAGAAAGAPAGPPPLWVLEFKPATADVLSQGGAQIGIPNFVTLGFQELNPGEERVAIPSSLYFAVIKRMPLQPSQRALLPVPVPSAIQPGTPLLQSSADEGLGTMASPPSPMPRLQLPAVATPGRERTSEPQTPTVAHEPYRELSVHTGSANAGSVHSSKPRLSSQPGSPPWSPRLFGQECPEELSDVVLGPLLGRGAHGKVYRGMWKGQKVAVKVMDCFVEAGRDSSATGPLLEATLSHELGKHPNIVQTLAVAVHKDVHEELVGGKQHQQVWIVQEYMGKGTLCDAVDRGWLRTSRCADAPPNMLSLLLTAQEMAAALSFLHAQNILHGDQTGANVLLGTAPSDPRGFIAKVSDFGVSRILSTMECETGTLGTISHMPPEMLQGGLLSRATDTYSWGVLCWEMYTSSHAWAGRRLAHIVHAKTVLKQHLVMPDSCPPAFKDLVERCLQDDHTQRPNCEEILAALASMLHDARTSSA